MDVATVGTNMCTRFGQLFQYDLKNVSARVGQRDVTPRCRSCYQKGPALNAIRHDLMCGAMQRADAGYGNRIGAIANNLRAHGTQAAGKIDHFRFARGVFQYRYTVCQRRRHHQIFCAGDTDNIK